RPSRMARPAERERAARLRPPRLARERRSERMKGFLIVLERELAERRLILLTGLLGFFPLLLPLFHFHGAASTGDRELRGMLALGLAGLVSGILALILGASII